MSIEMTKARGAISLRHVRAKPFTSGLGSLIDSTRKHLYHCPYSSVNANRQYYGDEKI
jgi:hypothetical protein